MTKIQIRYSLILFTTFFVIWLFGEFTSSSVTAQAGERRLVALQILDGQTSVYTVDSAGQFTLLHEFGDLFGVYGFMSSQWQVPTYQEIALSPDGRYLAFVELISKMPTQAKMEA